MTLAAPPLGVARPRLWNDPRWRSLVIQAALLVLVLAVLLGAGHNARVNMNAHGIPTNFAFWDRPAGFDVNQTLVAFNATYTYGRAFLVGLLNTLLVSALGVVFATILGFVIGIARLSPNWLLSRLALVYIEVLRNVPLLLQLFFWYFAVLRNLPSARESVSVLDAVELHLKSHDIRRIG